MKIHDRDTIEIRGKKIVILGLAMSGAAAAKLAVRQGADVFVSDNQDTPALQGTLTDLIVLGISGELGQHSDQIYAADLWIISPGIAQDSELVQKAQYLLSARSNFPAGSLKRQSWPLRVATVKPRLPICWPK